MTSERGYGIIFLKYVYDTVSGKVQPSVTRLPEAP